MKPTQRRTSISTQKLLRESLQSIAVKFILNLPRQQRTQKIRLAYHYKKAYYYYIDHELKEIFPNQDPKKVDFIWFCTQLNKVVMEYIKGLNPDDIPKILSQQRPTCGAIIFNQKGNKVLVTEAVGRYGFPKGCKNESEASQDCAARQVKQQIGLFIHRHIKSDEKVEFLGRGDVPVTFYIVRNFDQNQKITIDKNQIDNAFWMNISDVSKLLSKFTQKCRNGWRQYDTKLQIQPKLTMQQFLEIYRDRNKSKQKHQSTDMNSSNPLLNFKLDREKLFSVFKTVSNGPDDT